MGYSKKYGIERDTEEYFIVDSIRHAFSSFMFGGLEWLYKNREAENWYPKIIISKRIGSISLEGVLEIYRGTSKDEYDSGVFSQSWTLSKDVAIDFAFKHYAVHDDYINTERVVIKSRIDACHVYYHDESDDEMEVVIDVRELVEVPPTIISKKVLK